MGNRLRMALGRRVRGVAMALLAALAFSLSGPIPSTFAQGQVIEFNVGIRLANGEQMRRPQCLDSKAKMVFQVSDLDYNLVQLTGVPTVIVAASDGTEYEAVVSDVGGYAVIDYPLDTEGLIFFTANVQHNVNPPIQFTLEVVHCYWSFVINLDEEYDLSTDQSLKISSSAFVGGDLKRHPADIFGADSIEITDYIGYYSLSVSDTLEALDVFLDPAVSGDIQVELAEGYVGGGSVKLVFRSSAPGLPEMANIGFKDVTEQANEIYSTAPVPTTRSSQSDYGEGFDPIEKMMLRSVTFPETGGTVETNPDQVFIQTSDRISSTATIILKVSQEPQGPSTWIFP